MASSSSAPCSSATEATASRCETYGIAVPFRNCPECRREAKLSASSKRLVRAIEVLTFRRRRDSDQVSFHQLVPAAVGFEYQLADFADCAAAAREPRDVVRGFARVG